MAATIALIAAGNAGAATPQQIYKDLADNNRFDRKYSHADFERAFGNNPSIAGYVRPDREPERTPQSHVTPPLASSGDTTGGSLPFSGLDAALFALVGGPLLILGAGMRRHARVQAGRTT